MDYRSMAIDLSIVGAEIALLIITFAFILLVLRGLFRRLATLSAFAERKARIETVRRNLKGVLILLCVGLCLVVAAANGVLMYRGVDLLEHTKAWIQQIPPGFWVRLGLGFLKVVGIVVAATVALRYLHRLLAVVEQRAKDYEHIRANDESIEAFFRSLNHIITNTAWLVVLAFSTRALGFPEAVPAGITVAWKIYLTIAVGLLIVKGIDAVIDSLDALSAKYSSPENLLRFYDRLRHLIPLFKRCLEYIIYVYVATLVALQVEFISNLADHGPRIVRVIGIFFIARVVIEFSNLIIDEVLLKQKDLAIEKRQQRLTFVPLISSILKYLIYFGAAVLVLKELGINPTPILAGAGIVGLAVGLGAQNLVNDLVSGFFILFENHFLVGDFIETGDACGVVEAIDIRTTRVRNPNGQLHILRNGQIGEVINYSKGYTNAVVEVGVAYESDLEKVHRVLEDVGKKLSEESPDVLEPTAVQGLQEFGESELLIRTVTQVKPGKHLQVERRLRRKIKEAFDREGIEIPYARRVLIMKDEESAETLASASATPRSRRVHSS